MTKTHLHAFAWTDLGKKREKNEDSYLLLPKLHLYVVADGMGGHVGWQIASELAVAAIKELVTENLSEIKAKQAPQLMADALRAASKRIHEETYTHPELKGMGTTTTALLIYEKEAIVAHVGDSRIYLARAGELQQLSEDHSLVHEQYKAGLISAEQAKNSRFRNIITRSIGFEDDVDVDMMVLKTEPGDIFLLCTDGLTTLVEDKEILEIIEHHTDKTAGQKLINLANSRGGYDNTTVILVYV